MKHIEHPGYAGAAKLFNSNPMQFWEFVNMALDGIDWRSESESFTLLKTQYTLDHIEVLDYIRRAMATAYVQDDIHEVQEVLGADDASVVPDLMQFREQAIASNLIEGPLE